MYQWRCMDALCHIRASAYNSNRKLNEMFEHSIRPSGAFPISNSSVRTGRNQRRRGKKKVRYWKENKVCTSLMTVSIERRSARLWSSQSLHASAYCEFIKFLPQKRNSWEVLLDNKLPLKDLIAAHLEPLTHSSSTILSTWQEWKNARRSSPFNYSITRMETVITWKPRTSPRRRRVWSALRWWRVRANW